MAFDAALKMSDISLQLFTQEQAQEYLWFESYLRGGVVFTGNRLQYSNNENCENFDPLKPKTHIIYQDANNLYGFAQSQKLPYQNIKFCTPSELEILKREIIDKGMQDIDLEGDQGYCFEVSLKYTDETREKFSEFPPLPVKRLVDPSEISPFTKKLLETNNAKLSNIPKLINDVNDKPYYKLHMKNLKQAIELGAIVTDVHSAIKFDQSDFLKCFIERNTWMRNLSTSLAERDYFKLLNNSIYGKTLQNSRKYMKIEWIQSEIIFRKRVARTNFHSCKIINENACLIRMNQCEVLLNRPIYLGAVILDLSKHHMVDYFYNKVKPTFDRPSVKTILHTTDTDSLIMSFTYKDPKECFWKDLAKIKDSLDTSSYPDTHPYFQKNLDCFDDLKNCQNQNKMKVGKMKDEAGGNLFISAGCFLRSKMYSLKFSDGTKKQTLKGLDRRIVKNQISLEDYVKVLNDGIPQRHSMKKFRSENHCIYMKNLTKISLSLLDEKRYSCDNINTLPYGHPLIAR